MVTKSITVKIGKGPKAQKYPASKRVWDAADVTGSVANITTDELVKRLNYAEDLFVRRDCRTEHTESGVVTKRRTDTLMAIALGELGPERLAELKVLQGEIKSGAKSVKELNSYLDEVAEGDEADDVDVEEADEAEVTA